MHSIHRGKIGRLPRAIREQVNQRLEESEPGAPLLAWLNSLPEVQALLAREFKGQPISKQNLYLWRKYGFRTWHWRQEAQTVAAQTQNLSADQAPPLFDQMKTWAAVRYLAAVQPAIEQAGIGKPTFHLLRGFCRDLVALQRHERSTARLKLEHLRLSAKTTP